MKKVPKKKRLSKLEKRKKSLPKSTYESRKKAINNSVQFILGEKSFKAKKKAIKEKSLKDIKNLTYKKDLPPRTVIAHFKFGYSRQTKQRYLDKYDMELPDYFYNAFVVPHDMTLSPARIRDWIIDEIDSYEERSEQALESNPDYNLFDIYNLREITLQFIYEED